MKAMTHIREKLLFTLLQNNVSSSIEFVMQSARPSKLLFRGEGNAFSCLSSTAAGTLQFICVLYFNVVSCSPLQALGELAFRHRYFCLIYGFFMPAGMPPQARFVLLHKVLYPLFGNSEATVGNFHFIRDTVGLHLNVLVGYAEAFVSLFFYPLFHNFYSGRILAFLWAPEGHS